MIVAASRAALRVGAFRATRPLAAGLAARGAFRLEHLRASALAVVPALVGMAAGQALRERVASAAFRHWFLIVLLVLGAEMALRPLIGW